MKTYEVILFKSPLKSFSWGDGFYAIIETVDNEHRMCKIDDDGRPTLYDDGKFMITCTGIHNKGIARTSLKLQW